jgi:kynurenine formamidase
MQLIDLSGEIFHKCPTLPNHPPVTIVDYQTHDTIREAEGVKFSCASKFITLGEHTASHVDAPVHFDARAGAMAIDEVPLENFYTEAVCLDLSHKPLKSDINIGDLEEAVAVAGIDIRPRDTVLLHMAHYQRTFGTPAFLTDFPGLVKESAEWLGHKGIVAFGVEAVSPGRPGKHNFEVHLVCRDMGFTHYEGLTNLDKVVGKGRFRFIAFPLKIRGGTGSPVRAVAVIDD